MATINLAGSTSGTTSLIPTAIAGTGTLTLPTGTDTLVGKATTDTLTNKTVATAAQANNSTGLASTAYADRVAAQQVVSTITGAVATGTTIIPLDDTIPQNTEGDQYMTLAITPKSATSKLLISVVFNFGVSAVNNAIVALFQDSTANALACSGYVTGGADGRTIAFNYAMTSGTTSATTFKVRAGTQSGQTITFNGNGGARLFGGVECSSIIITEIGV